MSRSTKKGPFVEPKLLKRIEAMNENGTKEVLKLGQELQQYFHKWLDIQ